MIYPVPAGVDPNYYICGECDGRLTMPWTHELKDHILQCVNDHDHETYKSKRLGEYKMLYDPATKSRVEVDVLTQQPDTAIVIVKDESTALAVATRMNGLGKFPGAKQTEGELLLLAHVAFHYQMDLVMGEIMPYQGKPFITIKGRRRYDKREGNKGGITFRMPRPDELAYWKSVHAMADGDVVQIAILTEPDGTITEGFGRVLMSEQPTTSAGQVNLPIAIRKIEMAQKRAESRVREMVFGSIGKPSALDPLVQVGIEGQEGEVIEGTYTEIPQEDAFALPDLGECPEHGVQWIVKEDKYKRGAARGIHYITEGVPCVASKIYSAIFMSAWSAKFGEPNKKETDTWLKDKFEGATWSKMDDVQHIKAVQLLTVDQETGEIPVKDEDPDAELKVCVQCGDEFKPVEDEDNCQSCASQAEPEKEPAGVEDLPF